MAKRNDMPEVLSAIAQIPLSERPDWLDGICGRGGRLRATKPADPRAAYVWRMVAFQVSPRAEHHCMPVTADFGITDAMAAHRTERYVPTMAYERDKETVASWGPETWERLHRHARRSAYIREELDTWVKRVVDAIPPSQWHGVKRWRRALHGV
jgi:hypothetical protein